MASKLATVAVPLSAKRSVVKILKSVVFPAPSGPINPNNSPSFTSKEIFFSGFIFKSFADILYRNTHFLSVL